MVSKIKGIRGVKGIKRIKLTIIMLLATLCIGQLQAATDSLSIEEYRNNRGLVMLDAPLIPTGQWVIGTSASYSTHVNDNYSLMLVDGIVSNGYTVEVSPLIAYSIRPNMVIGGRFKYGRSLLLIEDAELNLGEDSGIDVGANNYFALNQSFTVMGILRQYIPIGPAERFALFTEFRLELGINESKYAHDYPVKGTYSKGVDLSLGVMPGIVAFATNEVAIEVTLGILGIGYSHTRQVENQIYVGESNSSNMNFMINLLSISLGVSFYL